MNLHDTFPAERELARLEEQHADFATFGKEVPVEVVPALVEAGFNVWSFGYDSDEQDGFTVLDECDLVGWNNQEADAMWGPFRVEINPE